jgi:phenylacetate-CoA ligase
MADTLRRPLKLAICIGENTTDDARAIIEGGFGCPVMDFYSGSEFGPVAIEDPRHRRLLVCEELAFVELNPAGDLADTSEPPAEIVCTPFYNYAMPLIRYAPGDYALVDADPAGDPRTLRRLKRIVGRDRNCFVLPSGRRWWPTYQNKVLWDFLDYRQIQFAQTARDRIEIRYASDQAEPVKDAERLSAYLREATPEPLDIVLVRLPEIARRASGKYEYATCEIA